MKMELTQENFEATVKEGIVLIDWWASWCGPCRAFAPIYDRVAAQNPDITFGKIDTEAEPGLASAFQIRAIPTLMAFKDGVLVFEQAGMMPALALAELVDKLRKLDMVEVKKKLAEHQKEHAAQA
ncbi:MAG: thioredoxin [Polyangiaceae bacterium]